jgi:hypothetical protein
MATILNAVSGTGLTQTADSSGVMKVQSNGVTTNALAWVNFNGVTTTTIRSSYNVSSVTRTAAGVYTINFANSMSDANYAANICSNNAANMPANIIMLVATGYMTFQHYEAVTNTAVDTSIITAAIFGN